MLIVPLFSIFRTLGLINSLPGLALVNVVFSVSFATLILAGYFRRIPREVLDAGRIDGAGRLALLTSLAIPSAARESSRSACSSRSSPGMTSPAPSS